MDLRAKVRQLARRRIAATIPSTREPQSGSRLSRNLSARWSKGGIRSGPITSQFPVMPGLDPRLSGLADWVVLRDFELLCRYIEQLLRVPAKAGTHGPDARTVEKWVPACAGTRYSGLGNRLKAANASAKIAASVERGPRGRCGSLAHPPRPGKTTSLAGQSGDRGPSRKALAGAARRRGLC